MLPSPSRQRFSAALLVVRLPSCVGPTVKLSSARPWHWSAFRTLWAWLARPNAIRLLPVWRQHFLDGVMLKAQCEHVRAVDLAPLQGPPQAAVGEGTPSHVRPPNTRTFHQAEIGSIHCHSADPAFGIEMPQVCLSGDYNVLEETEHLAVSEQVLLITDPALAFQSVSVPTHTSRVLQYNTKYAKIFSNGLTPRK